MELRHLRYFVAAAEEQHISRAADRLAVTRPAVSRIISDLEDELGTPLFERSAHRIRLTAAGRVLLARLQPMFTELRLTIELTRQAGAGKSGMLKIGYGATSLQHPVFRAAVRQVHADLPQVSLSFLEGRRASQLNALKDEALDVGFSHHAVWHGSRGEAGGGTAADDDQEFTHIPIQTGRLAVAVPAGHVLAGRKRLKLAELAHAAFITVPQASVTPDDARFAALCRAAGFEARVAQEAKNTEALLNLVAIGIGVGLLVTVPGARFPDDVRVIPLQGVPFETRYELTCLKARQSEPLIQRFAEIVRQFV